MVKTLPVGLLSVNCSVVVDEETNKALVVDPGAQAEKIEKYLDGLELVGVVATHGHVDHVGVVRTIKGKFQVPFYMNRRDVFLLNDPIWPGFEKQIGADLPCPEPDVFIEDGDTIQVGTLSLRVFHTPGHTPGLCCLYEERQKVLIAGDLLFKGGVGRWDLRGGDLNSLRVSLKRIFETFDDDVLVITGHYELTTIGQERRFNPYLRELL